MSMQEAIASIHESIDGIVRTVRGLSEEQIKFKPSEEAWSVQEIVAHVEEVIPYWLNELERVRQTPGVEWGRGLQDAARLEAVAKAYDRPVAEILNQIEGMKSLVSERLSQVTEEELKRESPSRNPRFGTKPASFIVDHLLVEHIAKHLGQIQRNLKQFEESH
jgi:uncharacterized damage-inducible protein DinB